MATYIHQRALWPDFQWDQNSLHPLLTKVHHRMGRLLGRMESLGFSLQAEATLQALTLEVVKSSEIEGELLDVAQVRSSLARRLGIDVAGLVPSDRNVEGIVEMMLDATQHYNLKLDEARLFSWHAALFPTGRNGMHKIDVGKWRNHPMEVVSGPMGKEKIHFEAPGTEVLDDEMNKFLTWFNSSINIDPIVKAAISHFWFVTVHPFDDGNGRIARAIADMQLSRADGTSQRFYSMSAQIRKERNAYYDALEETQKSDLNITAWIEWFLKCLDRALLSTDETVTSVFKKSKFWEAHGGALLNGRQKLMVNKLLDGFEGNLNSSKWAKIAKCSQDSALRDIQDLINKGILEKQPSGGRSTSYILTEW